MTTALDEYNDRVALGKKRRSSRGRKGRISSTVRELKIDGQPCRVCGPLSAGFTMEAHHLVPRAKFIGSGIEAPVHAPDNLIPLCSAHHQDHHTTANRIPRHLLTEAEQAFVFQHTSESWLDLWYPDTGGNA